jgi:hypothetical protein
VTESREALKSSGAASEEGVIAPLRAPRTTPGDDTMKTETRVEMIAGHDGRVTIVRESGTRPLGLNHVGGGKFVRWVVVVDGYWLPLPRFVFQRRRDAVSAAARLVVSRDRANARRGWCPIADHG